MNDKKYSIEMNEVRQVPRASMDEDKRRAYVEVCSALAFGKTLPDSLSTLKDRTAAMIRERANAAMSGDHNARVAINSILTILVEPAVLQTMAIFGLSTTHHQLGYSEIPEIETWRLVGGDARQQAYNGDVAFGDWVYKKYPVSLITISGGAQVDYRALANGNFDSKLPELVQHVTTDIGNKAVLYTMDTIYAALKNNTDYVKFYEEYSDTVTQDAIDGMVAKLRHFGKTSILADFSVISLISGWEGYKQVTGSATPFYTEDQVKRMSAEGKLDQYKGSYLVEIPNPYNINKPLADKSAFETYYDPGRILILPSGVDSPVHTFSRGTLTSMTGTDVKTGRYLDRYDLEFGATVVEGMEYKIGALEKNGD